MTEDCLLELDRTVRALRATASLMVRASREDSDPLVDTLVALDAARTVQAHADDLVVLLTALALRLGATLAALESAAALGSAAGGHVP